MFTAHEEVIRKTGGTQGVLQRGPIEAAVDRCRHGPFQRDGSIEERAALLLRGICQDHPFADGNKRTALAVVESFLEMNSFALEASQDELVEFLLRVAKIEVDLDEIQRWIQQHMQKV